MWPIARFINRLPMGRFLNSLLLVVDYRGVYNLSEEMLKEWGILDTFDRLSPFYHNPQTIDKVREWFNRAGMADVEVRYGYNGIEGRGTRVI